MAIGFRLNGMQVCVEAQGDTPLLDVLRNDFELDSPKFGCGLAHSWLFPLRRKPETLLAKEDLLLL